MKKSSLLLVVFLLFLLTACSTNKKGSTATLMRSDKLIMTLEEHLSTRSNLMLLEDGTIRLKQNSQATTDHVNKQLFTTNGGLPVSEIEKNQNILVVKLIHYDPLIINGEPLFVINGRIVKGGFEEAKRAVNPAAIVSIKVLDTPKKVARYGTDGLNGVIQIRLKKQQIVD